jgi:hypothetical protein
VDAYRWVDGLCIPNRDPRVREGIDRLLPYDFDKNELASVALKKAVEIDLDLCLIVEQGH